MSENPLENMRHRAAQCRKLAAITHDERMSYQLLDWAAEIETDIERLTKMAEDETEATEIDDEEARQRDA